MSEKDLQKSFDKLAENYDKTTTTFHHKISEYVLYENLKEELKLFSAPIILDAGCGTGKFALKLLKEGFDVTLLDLSEKSLAVAQGKIRKEGFNPRVFSGSVENMPFEDQSFDFVMMNGAVISYTVNPEKALKEAHRVLKKDGLLFFDFFNTIGWGIEIHDLEFKYDVADAETKLIQMPDWDYPARLMSLNYVRNMLSTAGYQIINEYGLINLTHSVSLDIRYNDLVEEEIVNKYKKLELALSRNKELLGSAWSCIISAKKM